MQPERKAPGARRHSGARLVGHVLLGFAQQGISVTVGIFLLPFMLWHLGAERYGLLLILQVVSVSGVLVYADAGLPAGLARYLAEDYVHRNMEGFRKLLTTGIAIFFVIGVACGLLVAGFGELLFFRVFQIPAAYQSELRTGIFLYAASFVTYFTGLAVKAFYTAINDLVRLRLWETLERLGYAVAVVAVLSSAPGILPIVIAEQVVLLLALLVFSGIAAVRYRELFRPHPTRFSLASLRRVMPMSVQVFVHRVTWLPYQKGPELLIASFLGPLAMAAYGIITKIPRVLKVLGSAVNSAAFPMAAALDSLEVNSRLEMLVLRGTRYGYLLITPLVAVLVVFAPEILRLWVGEEYVDLANLLRAFLVWQYAMLLPNFLGATLTRTEQYRQFLPFMIAGNVVFALISIAGVARYGLWAIVAALLVSIAVTAAGAVKVQISADRLSLGKFVTDVVGPISSAAAAVTLALIGIRGVFVPRDLFGLVAIVVAVYLPYVMLTYRMGLRESERAQLKPILRRLVWKGTA